MTIANLAALQLASGGFTSTVTSPRGSIDDCNGFTAAIVLRLTRRLPNDSRLGTIRTRALHYITTCSSAVVPGAFAFWPAAERPPWARSVPADVDDTAVMLTELLRHAWLDRADAIRRFCRVLLPQRVDPRAVDQLPPWIAPGCFYTWIGAGSSGDLARSRRNVVDCCVNANVIALMAFVGATGLPGYGPAIECVQNAVRWAGEDAVRLSSITPFYPSVANLIEALEHAVECGAETLEKPLRQLRSLGIEAVGERAGCCRSAYGSTVWHCEAIDVARELARSAADRAATGSALRTRSSSTGGDCVTHRTT